MRYYFNVGMNMCATEAWVADYLYMAGTFESREEAYAELRTKNEVYGWFQCDVSEDITVK